MRIARFRGDADAVERIGLVGDGAIVEVAETWLEALAKCTGTNPGVLVETGRRFRLSECEFLTPLPDHGRGVFLHRDELRRSRFRRRGVFSGRSRPSIR